MIACCGNRRHVWIEIIHRAASVLQQFHYLKRRAFADVCDILLVGEADDQYVRRTKRDVLPAIECLLELADYVFRHRDVDFARELDEARTDAKLARFPRQVERIDGDAMPSESGTGIERHVTEWLGLGCLDDLPDVYIHGAVDHLELVDEGDVD